MESSHQTDTYVCEIVAVMREKATGLYYNETQMKLQVNNSNTPPTIILDALMIHLREQSYGGCVGHSRVKRCYTKAEHHNGIIYDSLHINRAVHYAEAKTG